LERQRAVLAQKSSEKQPSVSSYVKRNSFDNVALSNRLVKKRRDHQSTGVISDVGTSLDSGRGNISQRNRGALNTAGYVPLA
jgi:hypothetical protein